MNVKTHRVCHVKREMMSLVAYPAKEFRFLVENSEYDENRVKLKLVKLLCVLHAQTLNRGGKRQRRFFGSQDS